MKQNVNLLEPGRSGIPHWMVEDLVKRISQSIAETGNKPARTVIDVPTRMCGDLLLSREPRPAGPEPLYVKPWDQVSIPIGRLHAWAQRPELDGEGGSGDDGNPSGEAPDPVVVHPQS